MLFSIGYDVLVVLVAIGLVLCILLIMFGLVLLKVTKKFPYYRSDEAWNDWWLNPTFMGFPLSLCLILVNLY